ncbi:MAG: TatD family hydrolase [Lachnospiraceae bacterium]|jgi:TatD DNase family protein|nr:TatD family hydrolase [Lachnospiraceae bacterium]
MIFDTHAHYDDERFDGDRDALLSGLFSGGVETVVNISSDLASVQKTLDLLGKYPFLYGTVGIHPTDSGELDEEKFGWVCDTAKMYRYKAVAGAGGVDDQVSGDTAARHLSPGSLTQWDENAGAVGIDRQGMADSPGRIVAIGEIGLDYYWKEPEREIQKKWFRRQLELARECALPVVIHSRDAAQDTLTLLKEAHGEEIGGVFHCFSYSPEVAAQVLGMGFYLGIGGVVTFANAKKLKEVVAAAPLEKLVLETDAPYLAPVPYRGKRNSSLYLPYVVEEIARIRGIPEEEVIQATNRNAKELFRIGS